MKRAKSCLQCRESKRKCVPSVNGACGHCQRRHLPCSSLTNQPPTAPESKTHLVAELTENLTIEFAEHYFRHLDGRAHSIFHQHTLRQQLKNKQVGKALLYAICALGCKFSPDAKHRALETVLTKEAKILVQTDLENVCVENVQTCVLLALLSAGNCQTSSEALFARLAVSMAEILHLNMSSTHGSPILDETSHRVWWSLYILDRWCLSGLGLPRHMENTHCPDLAPLPINELSFQALPLPSVHELAQKPGIFTHKVTLVRHFGPIQDLNRSIARGNMEPIKKCEAVKRIGQQLESWRQALPEPMHMSIQNLYIHQQNNLGSHFIALHLAFHHFSALLYFNSLESKINPYYGQDEHVAKCKSHASSFSSLLHLSRQMNDCEQNYPTVGHMTNVASAVLLHTLLLGEPEDIPKARQELNTNFEALVELRRYWPATEAMMNRLMTFQKICLLSTESHKLDGWMVRFLLEHSLGLGERTMPIIPQNIELEAGTLLSKTRELSQEGRYTDFDQFHLPFEPIAEEGIL
ncbi:hypothetical protein ACHAPU_009948 [Fusarium lateritium]